MVAGAAVISPLTTTLYLLMCPILLNFLELLYTAVLMPRCGVCVVVPTTLPPLLLTCELSGGLKAGAGAYTSEGADTCTTD